MLITSRIVPCMCDSKKLSIHAIRKKFTRGEIIKRIMKEQKQCFGSLLETSKEKSRRLKQQKKGKLLQTDTNENDSELSWIMKVSDSRLKRIKLNIDHSISLLPEKNSVAQTGPVYETVSPVERSDQKLAENGFSKTLLLEGTPIARYANYPRLPRVQFKISKETWSTEKTVTEAGIERIMNLPEVENFPKFTLNNSKIREFTKDKAIADEKAPQSDPSWNTIKPNREKVEPLALTLSLEDVVRNINEARLFREEKEEDLKDFSQDFEFPAMSIPQIAANSRLPSVTKILNATMSDEIKQSLKLWISKMINEIGQDDFFLYKKDLLENGKLFRCLIGDSLRKLPRDVPGNLQPCFNSAQNILKEVNHVRAIESAVVHHELGYSGVVDCVASFRGKLCVIDWKRSNQPKNMTSTSYDAPLKLASYIGALNADKNYPFQVKSGALVVAYTTGNKPAVFLMDEAKLQKYWDLWLKRLKKYYEMQIS